LYSINFALYVHREVAERNFPTEYQLTHSLYTEASNLDWDQISHR
jgi:hypothetical protein